MAKKEFTATEVMMLLEDMRKGIQIIAEQLTGLTERITRIETDVRQLKEDMAIVKASLQIKVNRSEFEALDKRVTVLESKTA
ncbi:hypothetical protein HY065_02650 [Candidatus Berkelbacteria bacterium]|nr:hypothetical protein [Candidatus Berkelbacteria bacterium]